MLGSDFTVTFRVRQYGLRFRVGVRVRFRVRLRG